MSKPDEALRDRFAGEAMIGILFSVERWAKELKDSGSKLPLELFIASLAYRHADAMLEVRTHETNKPATWAGWRQV